MENFTLADKQTFEVTLTVSIPIAVEVMASTHEEALQEALETWWQTPLTRVLR